MPELSFSGHSHSLPATAANVYTGYFDKTQPPVLCIESGDTVSLQTMMLHDDQLRPGMTMDDLAAIGSGDPRRIGHSLTGPISVNGAEPGDVLEIRILKLVPRPYAVNYVRPGSQNAGALPEDFPQGQFKSFVLDLKAMTTQFCPGITVPLRPFMGIMAVAPQEPGRLPTAPPREFGGNIDCSELTEGTILYLPVFNKGGLFSTGDAHAAQGDGEVCITALETAMDEAVFQFIVRKDMSLNNPLVETPTHWITLGFDSDLNIAVKKSLRGMIDFLTKNMELSPLDAYQLASIAANLRVTQVVDGNKGIHTMIAKSLFTDHRG